MGYEAKVAALKAVEELRQGVGADFPELLALLARFADAVPDNTQIPAEFYEVVGNIGIVGEHFGRIAQELPAVLKDEFAVMKTTLIYGCFIRGAARPTDNELAEVIQIAELWSADRTRRVEQAAAAREQAAAYQRDQAIHREADTLTVSDVIAAYGNKISVNHDGKLVASRGAGLGDRDRTIIKHFEDQLIPILKQRMETEIL